VQGSSGARRRAALVWLRRTLHAITPPRLRRRYEREAAFRRRVHRLAAWSFVLILGHGFLFGDEGLAGIVVRAVRVWRLERQVAALERRQAWLQREVELRESDPAKLERLARERYGMVQPGETVYRIEEITAEQARRIEREQQRLRDQAERDLDATEEAAPPAAPPDRAHRSAAPAPTRTANRSRRR
jgi:cell division protein FtsB